MIYIKNQWDIIIYTNNRNNDNSINFYNGEYIVVLFLLICEYILELVLV